MASLTAALRAKAPLSLSLTHTHTHTQLPGVTSVFDTQWLQAAQLIVSTWILEQNHDKDKSPYKYHSEMPRQVLASFSCFNQ